MTETKALLIERNGRRCMACGRNAGRHIEWHHICPKYVFRQNKLPIDNSYENGSLLCNACHAKIHNYLYWEEEYQKLTELILDHKR